MSANENGSVTMTGAQIVLQALADQGVEHIFGYPGGAVLPIYDELFQQERIKHILVRHEQGAVHAAEGYARSTGKVGVVLVTSGPGATNAVTGLTDALMDSIPVVCITGQVPTHLIGNDAFQECDTVGITHALAPADASCRGRQSALLQGSTPHTGGTHVHTLSAAPAPSLNGISLQGCAPFMSAVQESVSDFGTY